MKNINSWGFLGKRKIVSIVIILVILLLGSIVVFRKMYSYYIDNKILLLNLPTADILRENRHYDILIFGDSRVSDWAVLNFENLSSINAGRAGMTSAQGVQLILEYILACSPDTIIIQLGINDIKTIGMIKNRGEKRRVAEYCTNNLKRIISICLEHNIRVLFLDIIFPRWLLCSVPSSIIDEINESVSDYFMDNNMYYNLDLNAILAENGKLLRRYSKNNLHFNDSAYEIISSKVKDFLHELLEEEK